MGKSNFLKLTKFSLKGMGIEAKAGPASMKSENLQFSINGYTNNRSENFRKEFINILDFL